VVSLPLNAVPFACCAGLDGCLDASPDGCHCCADYSEHDHHLRKPEGGYAQQAQMRHQQTVLLQTLSCTVALCTCVKAVLSLLQQIAGGGMLTVSRY